MLYWVEIRISVTPLYSRWQAAINKDREIDDFAEFNFKAIAAECYDLDKRYDEIDDMDECLLSYFTNEFASLLDQIDNAEQMCVHRKKMITLYEGDNDEELEPWVDEDLLYATLRNGQYHMASEMLKALDEEDYEESFINAELLKEGKFEEIERILQKNIDENKAYLTSVLKLF